MRFLIVTRRRRGPFFQHRSTAAARPQSAVFKALAAF
jgi:hypothetical protein